MRREREWSLSLPGNKTAAASRNCLWRRTAALALRALALNLSSRPRGRPSWPTFAPAGSVASATAEYRPSLRRDFQSAIKGRCRRRNEGWASEASFGAGRACLLVAFSRPNRLFNVSVLRENKKREADWISLGPRMLKWIRRLALGISDGGVVESDGREG